ncbi:hypothetical protein [Amycolatopsis taiwanensis]|uniref:Uncharacterized protein n=1 Tax=Amycolatopsis taiwanensis TaxID=342230 RepID=A0A9W6R7P8_9PSEU|nr:hypothetical protein [Amycolatopsis taiwanensis]GLY69072.1 hypothetical protein Atai01_56910 [Amycolatopsis taiwanensis]
MVFVGVLDSAFVLAGVFVGVIDGVFDPDVGLGVDVGVGFGDGVLVGVGVFVGVIDGVFDPDVGLGVDVAFGFGDGDGDGLDVDDEPPSAEALLTADADAVPSTEHKTHNTSPHAAPAANTHSIRRSDRATVIRPPPPG